MKLVFTFFLLIISSLSAEAKSGLEARFPNGLYNVDGKSIDYQELKGKVIAVYFSADWCGHCKVFTPKLLKYYQKHRDNFEVVFVSSDQSEKHMQKYMRDSKMLWLHMKFKSYAVNWIETDFHVYRIPRLVLLNDQAEIMSTNGKDLIEKGVEISKIKAANIKKSSYFCKDCEESHERFQLDF